MSLALAVVRIALATVFVAAAIGKLLDLDGSRKAVADFGLPERAAGLLGALLPLAELVTAAALILTASARWGGIAALLLLLAFIGGIARLMRLGEAPDCHCFGQLHSEPAGAPTLVRNAILAVGAALVSIGGAGRSLSVLSGEDLVLVAFAVGLLALAAYAYSLSTQNGELAQRPRGRPAGPIGLPVGTPAPELKLQTLAGDELALSALVGDGTPAVLVHVSPQCGPCRGLAPDLSHWQKTIGSDLRVMTIGSGTLAANTEFAEEVGLGELLVTEARTFGDAYQARATPSAVLIDGDGRVAARTVAGRLGVEALIRVALLRGGSEIPREQLRVTTVAPRS